MQSRLDLFKSLVSISRTRPSILVALNNHEPLHDVLWRYESLNHYIRFLKSFDMKDPLPHPLGMGRLFTPERENETIDPP